MWIDEHHDTTAAQRSDIAFSAYQVTVMLVNAAPSSAKRVMPVEVMLVSKGKKTGSMMNWATAAVAAKSTLWRSSRDFILLNLIINEAGGSMGLSQKVSLQRT